MKTSETVPRPRRRATPSARPDGDQAAPFVAATAAILDGNASRPGEYFDTVNLFWLGKQAKVKRQLARAAVHREAVDHHGHVTFRDRQVGVHVERSRRLGR